MHRRSSPFGGLLLLIPVLKIGINNIPPVTLSILLLCSSLYYNFLNWQLPSLNNTSLLPLSVIYYKEYYRLITSSFLHGSDLHLYYNMISLLMKGIFLEKRMGSLRFGLVCSLFVVTSNVLYVFISYILDRYFHYSGPMYSQTVGFSSVLFALNVIANANTEGLSSVMGIIVPTKFVYWVELLVSSLFPNVSFLGHLCGIFSGLLYVKGYLSPIIETILSFITGRPGSFGSFSNRNRRSYTYHVGTANSNPVLIHSQVRD